MNFSISRTTVTLQIRDRFRYTESIDTPVYLFYYAGTGVRICLKLKNSRYPEVTILEIPLSVGAPVTAAVILGVPLLAAIGAFAALVTECTIEVEKIDE